MNVWVTYLRGVRPPPPVCNLDRGAISIDGLINNARIMPLSALERLKVDELDRMIDVNINGVVYGVAAALPSMKARKSGYVITTAPVVGRLVLQLRQYTRETSLPCTPSAKAFARR